MHIRSSNSLSTSIEAIEEREKMLAHRESILEAELSRLAGDQSYSIEAVRNRLKEKYNNAKVQS